MAATTTAGRDVTSDLAFLTRALKAPSLREAVGRLAERARAEAWTHEEFLAACLQREVAARDAYGEPGRRVRAYGRLGPPAPSGPGWRPPPLRWPSVTIWCGPGEYLGRPA